jgi:Ca2+-binding EF-hand superfamily protein
MKKDGIGIPCAVQQPLTHPDELRRLFSEIDTDASGCLDKEELQVC